MAIWLLPFVLSLMLQSAMGIRADMDAELLANDLKFTDLSDKDACGEQVWGALTRKSAWRRLSSKCKCPRGQMVVCNNPEQSGDCEDIGRKFNGKLYAGQACRCGLCNTTCAGVVPGSQLRNSAWRRTTITCKCTGEKEIRGEGVCFAMRMQGQRKFSRKQLRGKECSCVEKAQVDEPAPAPTKPSSCRGGWGFGNYDPTKSQKEVIILNAGEDPIGIECYDTPPYIHTYYLPSNMWCSATKSSMGKSYFDIEQKGRVSLNSNKVVVVCGDKKCQVKNPPVVDDATWQGMLEEWTDADGTKPKVEKKLYCGKCCTHVPGPDVPDPGPGLPDPDTRRRYY